MDEKIIGEIIYAGIKANNSQYEADVDAFKRIKAKYRETPEWDEACKRYQDLSFI